MQKAWARRFAAEELRAHREYSFGGQAQYLSQFRDFTSLAIQGNAFSDRLSKLRVPRRMVVLAHDDFTSGIVDRATPLLECILATPGDLLQAPIPAWWRSVEPMLKRRQNSEL